MKEGFTMRWRDFRKTEAFKAAGIVFCVRDNKEVSPRPFDQVLRFYPVRHPEYPHIPTIVCEFF